MKNLPKALDVVHLLRWIASYPVDKVIRSLNYWGKVIFARASVFFSASLSINERKKLHYFLSYLKLKQLQTRGNLRATMAAHPHVVLTAKL